jgi:hypothetical protein
MYVAHMRTIIDEYFSNNAYYNRVLQLQQIVDAAVMADPNYLFSYADFQSNINSTVPFSMGDIIGITELMNARVTYLQSLPEFTAIPPAISNITSSPVNPIPHSTVTISAQITNATNVYLGYRFKFHDKFTKVNMTDNGSGLYSAPINIDARDVQYYIYAENANAGIFSPERAEKEFHQLSVVSGLVINEIMASNTFSVADQNGEFDDWVELYNGYSSSVNLNGYYLSDNENDLTKWSFPNVTIPANDYLIVWCDTAGGTQAGLHTTYRLSADQEEVYLTNPIGTVVDAVHFVNMPNDVSYARVPNGTGTFIHQGATHEANNQIISTIAQVNLSSKLRVYPNPSNNRMYILGATETIRVFNMIGQEVFSQDDAKSIDISTWESGIYFVKSGDSVVKIIKQ